MILALTKESKRSQQILGFAGWLEGKSGITSAVRIIDGTDKKAASMRKETQKQLAAEIKEVSSTAFPLVVAAPNFSDGLSLLAQTYGIGPVRPNTLLVNWIDDMGKGLSGLGALEYGRNLKTAFRLGLNVLILDTDHHKWDKLLAAQKTRTDHDFIDVWWEDNSTGDFMLLAAYLITRNELFKNVAIRLIARGSTTANEEFLDQLKRHLEEVRINAEPLVTNDWDHHSIIEISSRSTLVFMSFRLQNYRFSDISGGSLDRLLPQLGMTVLAKAAQDIDLDAEPDKGILGDLATASDEVEQARKHYEETYSKTEKLKELADNLSLRLARLDPKDETRESLIAESDRAIRDYEEGYRKALKARVKLGVAIREFEQLERDEG